jgi:hypothetical protein
MRDISNSLHPIHVLQICVENVFPSINRLKNMMPIIFMSTIYLDKCCILVLPNRIQTEFKYASENVILKYFLRCFDLSS